AAQALTSSARATPLRNTGTGRPAHRTVRPSLNCALSWTSREVSLVEGPLWALWPPQPADHSAITSNPTTPAIVIGRTPDRRISVLIRRSPVSLTCVAGPFPMDPTLDDLTAVTVMTPPLAA